MRSYMTPTDHAVTKQWPTATTAAAALSATGKQEGGRL